MPKREGENYLALTRPLPDLISWSAIVPDPLRTAVNINLNKRELEYINITKKKF